MNVQDNPWADRFAGALDPETIRRLATFEPTPLTGLRKLPVEAACKQLEMALEDVFYPTAQCISILQHFIGVAHAHSLMYYTDRKCFLAKVYEEKSPLPNFFAPICLTGLSGIGKSKLLAAYARIQTADRDLIVDTHHTPFPLQSLWSVTVESQISANEVLRALASQEGDAAALLKSCRKTAFRNGVPLLLVDEFQFATGSSGANTRVSQILAQLGCIGIPYVYVANFSLLHRLKKRPHEERARLLAKLIVAVPDAPDSQDWINTLAAKKRVAPEVLQFDPLADARSLHRLSAGLKRAVAHLCVQTFRNVHSKGGVVDLAAMERTYNSGQFATFREETETIMRQSIENCPIKGRLDLWCPFPLPKDAAAIFQADAIAARQERVAEAELRGALTGTERKAADEIGKTLRKKPEKSADVLKFKKAGKDNSEELLANTQLYREDL